MRKQWPYDWHQAYNDVEWPMTNCFNVLGAGQRESLLKRDLEAQEWSLGRRW